MQTVKLKNGTEEPRVVVAATMVSLQAMFRDAPIIAYEFVSVCRDPLHKIWSGKDQMVAAGFMNEDGKMHDTIRNVTLSALDGEGMGMTLGSPVAQ